MKERPIIMRDWEVRAVLESRKTQLRRIVKPQPPNFIKTRDGESAVLGWHEWGEFLGGPGWAIGAKWGMQPWYNGPKCPHGKIGDSLWVKETFRPSYETDTGARLILFRAGGFPEHIPSNRGWDLFDGTDRWRSPVTMPRWASRITLEITDVRVERLQDISEEDARAEGITDGGCLNCGESEPCGCANPTPDARDGFAQLWESTHGPGSWNENPWVWVIEFKQAEGGAE